MNEDIQFCLDSTEESMQSALVHMEREFQKIRAGKASPQMLDGIKVDCYGAMMPLTQLSNIHTPDPKSLVIQPWDKNLIKSIEKAILNANLGFNPVCDSELIRILVPPLTEERRKDLVKKTRQEAESTKVGIRNSRRIANETAKTLQKDGAPEDEIKKLEKDIQDMTNDFIAKADKILENKEKEIMTV